MRERDRRLDYFSDLVMLFLCDEGMVLGGPMVWVGEIEQENTETGTVQNPNEPAWR